MALHPKEKAGELVSQLGDKALEEAEKQYGVALEMLDLKQQGYWLDVIDHIKNPG
ncbi:hypothetical protein [Gluconacetobacter takamatsuzukensis]|uniref:Uncharacterized protein n=1 Tax=Gluconacetobacter takamatsuzukensis TaxID=1286190 RepID=A0A7W4KBR7_9PROT|nr:hypothetical protein [Gluconacetobacter takamatsuzukensis]MBB2203925.1 hypothetical protein [Gluconacetobacter takamatsuzukensis]